MARPSLAALAAAAVLAGWPSPGAAQERPARPPAPAGAAEAAVAPAPVPAAWVGFSFEPRHALRSDGHALVVTDVSEGSPAARAGFVPGDVIRAIDGRPVTVEGIRVLARTLRPGQPLSFTLLRDGRLRRAEVVAEPRPAPRARRVWVVGPRQEGAPRLEVVLEEESAGANAEPAPFEVFIRRTGRAGDGPRPAVGRATEGPAARAWAPRPLSPYLAGRDRAAGARVVPLNRGLAPYFGTSRGLLVVDVEDGTPASGAGLVPGDVLLEVARVAVADLDDLRSALTRRGSGDLPLRLLRKGRALELRLPR